jgi:hypothetical protein
MKIPTITTAVLGFLMTTKIARLPAHRLPICITMIGIGTTAATEPGIEVGIEVKTAIAIQIRDYEIVPDRRTIHPEESETEVTIQDEI